MSEVPAERFGMAGAGRTTVFQLSIAIGAGLAIALVGDAVNGYAALEAFRRGWSVGSACCLAQVLMFWFVFPSDSERIVPTG